MSPMSSWGDILTEQLGGDISIDQQQSGARRLTCGNRRTSIRPTQSVDGSQVRSQGCPDVEGHMPRFGTFRDAKQLPAPAAGASDPAPPRLLPVTCSPHPTRTEE